MFGLLISFSVLCYHFSLTHAALGIDVSTSVSVDSWSCMVDYGYSYAIVRGYLSYGAVDTNVIPTLEAAEDAGIDYRDIYMFPCRGLDASDQMSELIEYLNDNSFIASEDYNYVWLDLESNPKTSCYWSTYSGDSNCDYVQELVSTAESYNVQIGIYSSYYNWELIFGSASYECGSLTDYPLWYAHYDDDASFDDWDTYAIGGWDAPSMKQYVGDDTLCSTGIDKNYAYASFFDDYYGNGGTTGGTDCSDPETAGDVSVSFPSGNSLTSVESCDSNYDDPNDMGVYLFSEDGSGSDTYVADNFQVKEFVSPDGDDYFRLSPLLVECVQAVRTDINEALYVKEAYRTVSYNSDNGGASSSRHLSGTAADLYAGSADVLTVAESIICNCWELFSADNYGIGLGLDDDFVHVDIRDSYAYWVEDAAQYDSSEWNDFITEKYESCVGGTVTGGGGGTDGGSTNTESDDDSTNDDGTIAFPNADLTPVSYSDSKYDDPNDSGTYLFSVSDARSDTYLSDNFQVNEFDCNDGSDGFRLSPKLVECLQAVRDDLGVSISINSGYRTTTYNSYVGGATYSRHTSGTAADIQQYSTDIFTFADSVICNCRSIFLANGQEIGIGLGGSYLHVDMRPYYSYWVYSDASLSSSSWNSYISSTYSNCPSTLYSSQYVVAGTNSSLGAIADADEEVNSNDDIDEATANDIDNEEVIEGLSDDSSGSGSGSGSSNNSNGDDNSWVTILLVIVGVAIVIGIVSIVIMKRYELCCYKPTAGELHKPLAQYADDTGYVAIANE